MAKKANILLVDDYEVNIDLLEAYLELSDIPVNIYKAYNGAQAYAYIEQQSLDMILLDVMLPDTSGYDICRHLKNIRMYQNIPVIMITALNDKESMLEGLKAGADEFLTKPVDSHELILRVRNLLKMKAIANDLDERYTQLHNELVIATELQKSFLPQTVPAYDNIELEVLYKPSSFIGGDFYDFLQIDATRLGILICDVKGHGVASAMITATIKFQLNSLQDMYLHPEQLLEQLNNGLEHFFSHTSNDFFVTACYGVLDLEQRTFTYSNAGHGYPCHCRKDGITMLENQKGLPLGILADVEYDCQQVQLAPEESLFLYTDGIFEIELRQKEKRSCSSLPDFFADEQEPVNMESIEELKQEIRKYTWQNQIADDINFIAITFRK